MKKFVIALVLLMVLLLSGIAYAAMWQCRWCGRKQSAPNQPAPMSNCKKNPFGRHHDWVKIS